MKDINKILSKKFIRFVAEKSIGFLPPEKIDELLELFAVQFEKFKFSGCDESNLIRIISARYDRYSFFGEIIKYPLHSEILCAIAVNSNYLTDIVVGSPEFLPQIFIPSYLSHNFTAAELRDEISKGIGSHKTFGARLNFLRVFKKRILLAIGTADILGIKNLRKVSAELSYLAAEICSALIDMCADKIFDKYKIKNYKKEYALISLGKLGGMELNYSSDADFIFIFEENAEVPEARKSYYEILSEAVQLFIRSAGEITDKGFMYRIDFRLRPDGKHSPLCRTLRDTILYYETRGADWERQMLIKTGYSGGSLDVFNSFKKFADSYAYDYSSPREILKLNARMKESIENELKNDRDIKKSKGGIRDIEFAVQALQIINTNKLGLVKTGNTLEAIEELTKYNALKIKEADIFRAAYILFRKIEHFLQLMNNNQTHSIPERGKLLDRLAYFLGYNNSEEFELKLKNIKTEVRRVYESIIYPDKELGGGLPAINFVDKKNILKDLQFLRTGMSIFNQSMFDRRTIKKFRAIEPVLFDYLSNSDFPDETVKNLAAQIRFISFPSIWYGEFKDEKFFKAFLKHCEFNRLGIDEIISNKNLAEIILSRKALTMKNAGELDSIPQLKLVLSIQYLLNIIDERQVSEKISSGVETIAKSESENLEIREKYFIAGLGSFAENSMSFRSDVDLIFVSRSQLDSQNIQSQFQTYFNRLKESARGIQFDCRLRPEGKSSRLVWDIAAYESYFENRARVWEFIALSKIKFIAGDYKLFGGFKNILRDKLFTIDKQNAVREIAGMFGKAAPPISLFPSSKVDLKNSAGGIKTVDFILQFFLIMKPEIFILADTSFEERYELLANEFVELSGEIYLLKVNYLFLKKLRIIIQITENTRHAYLSKNAEEIKKISALANIRPEKLIAKVTEILNQNKKIFDTVKNYAFKKYT